MTPIRLMIVDDEAAVRRGLSVYFDIYDNVEVVAEAADGVEAVELCDEVSPDIILMDIRMPNMDGVTATKAIHEKHPRIQIIALTSVYVESVINEMLDAGAYSYLLKDAGIDELMNSIVAANKASEIEQ